MCVTVRVNNIAKKTRSVNSGPREMKICLLDGKDDGEDVIGLVKISILFVISILVPLRRNDLKDV